MKPQRGHGREAQAEQARSAAPGNPTRQDMSWPFWLGLPLLSVAICWLTPLLGAARWRAWMMDETGFWENATVGLLVCAVALCVALVLRRGRLPRWMIVYVALVALVAVYFAGEEASWGQHWFGYRTPEPVARANRQREFNLHNLGGTYRSAFNRLPRKLAIWGMLIGGVILPVVLIPWRRRPGRNLGPADWLIPTWRLVPAAALFSLSTAPEHLLKDYLPQLRRSAYLEMAFVTPSEEFKEFMLAAGILLYVVSIFARSRAAAQPPQA